MVATSPIPPPLCFQELLAKLRNPSTQEPELDILLNNHKLALRNIVARKEIRVLCKRPGTTNASLAPHVLSTPAKSDVGHKSTVYFREQDPIKDQSPAEKVHVQNVSNELNISYQNATTLLRDYVRLHAPLLADDLLSMASLTTKSDLEQVASTSNLEIFYFAEIQAAYACIMEICKYGTDPQHSLYPPSAHFLVSNKPLAFDIGKKLESYVLDEDISMIDDDNYIAYHEIQLLLEMALVYFYHVSSDEHTILSLLKSFIRFAPMQGFPEIWNSMLVAILVNCFHLSAVSYFYTRFLCLEDREGPFLFETDRQAELATYYDAQIRDNGDLFKAIEQELQASTKVRSPWLGIIELLFACMSQARVDLNGSSGSPEISWKTLLDSGLSKSPFSAVLRMLAVMQRFKVQFAQSSVVPGLFYSSVAEFASTFLLIFPPSHLNWDQLGLLCTIAYESLQNEASDRYHARLVWKHENNEVLAQRGLNSLMRHAVFVFPHLVDPLFSLLTALIYDQESARMVFMMLFEGLRTFASLPPDNPGMCFEYPVSADDAHFQKALRDRDFKDAYQKLDGEVRLALKQSISFKESVYVPKGSIAVSNESMDLVVFNVQWNGLSTLFEAFHEWKSLWQQDGSLMKGLGQTEIVRKGILANALFTNLLRYDQDLIPDEYVAGATELHMELLTIMACKQRQENTPNVVSSIQGKQGESLSSGFGLGLQSNTSSLVLQDSSLDALLNESCVSVLRCLYYSLPNMNHGSAENLLNRLFVSPSSTGRSLACLVLTQLSSSVQILASLVEFSRLSVRYLNKSMVNHIGHFILNEALAAWLKLKERCNSIFAEPLGAAMDTRVSSVLVKSLRYGLATKYLWYCVASALEFEITCSFNPSRSSLIYQVTNSVLSEMDSKDFRLYPGICMSIYFVALHLAMDFLSRGLQTRAIELQARGRNALHLSTIEESLTNTAMVRVLAKVSTLHPGILSPIGKDAFVGLPGNSIPSMDAPLFAVRCLYPDYDSRRYRLLRRVSKDIRFDLADQAANCLVLLVKCLAMGDKNRLLDTFQIDWPQDDKWLRWMRKGISRSILDRQSVPVIRLVSAAIMYDQGAMSRAFLGPISTGPTEAELDARLDAKLDAKASPPAEAASSIVPKSKRARSQNLIITSVVQYTRDALNKASSSAQALYYCIQLLRCAWKSYGMLWLEDTWKHLEIWSLLAGSLKFLPMRLAEYNQIIEGIADQEWDTDLVDVSHESAFWLLVFAEVLQTFVDEIYSRNSSESPSGIQGVDPLDSLKSAMDNVVLESFAFPSISARQHSVVGQLGTEIRAGLESLKVIVLDENINSCIYGFLKESPGALPEFAPCYDLMALSDTLAQPQVRNGLDKELLLSAWNFNRLQFDLDSSLFFVRWFRLCIVLLRSSSKKPVNKQKKIALGTPPSFSLNESRSDSVVWWKLFVMCLEGRSRLLDPNPTLTALDDELTSLACFLIYSLEQEDVRVKQAIRVEDSWDTGSKSGLFQASPSPSPFQIRALQTGIGEPAASVLALQPVSLPCYIARCVRRSISLGTLRQPWADSRKDPVLYRSVSSVFHILMIASRVLQTQSHVLDLRDDWLVEHHSDVDQLVEALLILLRESEPYAQIIHAANLVFLSVPDSVLQTFSAQVSEQCIRMFYQHSSQSKEGPEYLDTVADVLERMMCVGRSLDYLMHYGYLRVMSEFCATASKQLAASQASYDVFSGERILQHRIWCKILMSVALLIESLKSSNQLKTVYLPDALEFFRSIAETLCARSLTLVPDWPVSVMSSIFDQPNYQHLTLARLEEAEAATSVLWAFSSISSEILLSSRSNLEQVIEAEGSFLFHSYRLFRAEPLETWVRPVSKAEWEIFSAGEVGSSEMSTGLKPESAQQRTPLNQIRRAGLVPPSPAMPPTPSSPEEFRRRLSVMTPGMTALSSISPVIKHLPTSDFVHVMRDRSFSSEIHCTLLRSVRNCLLFLRRIYVSTQRKLFDMTMSIQNGRGLGLLVAYLLHASHDVLKKDLDPERRGLWYAVIDCALFLCSAHILRAIRANELNDVLREEYRRRFASLIDHLTRVIPLGMVPTLNQGELEQVMREL